MQKSDRNDTHRAAPIGWLLLRDGHAVPLSGLAPDELKRACRGIVRAPGASIDHARALKALVGQLGFRGDFGDYRDRHWPALQALLRDHGCGAWRNLFSVDDGDVSPFYFGPTFGPQRRQLADRIFVGDGRTPTRVFLGVDIDWRVWERRADVAYAETLPLRLSQNGHRAATASPEQVLIANRHDLAGQWGFVDDKLVAGELTSIVDKTYHAAPRTPAERDAHAAQILAVVRAFRATFPEDGPGWVDILRLDGSDRLAILRAHDGTWDVVWRDLRAEAPPPEDEAPARYALHTIDLPVLLAGEQDLARRVYFRRGWDEREAHDAEQHFYDLGKTAEERRRTSDDEVRRLWDASGLRARARRVVSAAPRPPAGFHEVRVAGRALWISDLITVGEYRAMLDDGGYLERRPRGSDDWFRANDPDSVPPTAPVGATWHDAQAYCAWKEQALGGQLRLPTLAELRAIRPFDGPHYKFLSEHDFPWENYPPRPLAGGGPDGGGPVVPVPSGVTWSEPRFVDPDPANGIAELPPPGGWGGGRGRKRWITDFPPRAAWRDDAWAEYSGLRFIDAWDAYEWAQEQGMISGRFWEGPIGVDSWGAYKNAKVGFRVVIATP
jgi:hypothetical protein